MSTIVYLRVPFDGFSLGRVLKTRTFRSATLEQCVSPTAQLTLHFWVQFSDTKGPPSPVDPIEAVDAVESGDAETLYRVTWSDDVRCGRSGDVLAAVAETDASILDVEGQPDCWRFKLRFDDGATSRFYQYCQNNGIDVEVLSLTDETEQTRHGLTERQHEVLSLAVREGYFEIPRQTNLEELSRSLDITRGAASEAIRRAQANFFTDYFDGRRETAPQTEPRGR